MSEFTHIGRASTIPKVRRRTSGSAELQAGQDWNPRRVSDAPEARTRWKFVTKIDARDLMHGKPAPGRAGALRRPAIAAAGFQRPAPVDGPLPQRRRSGDHPQRTRLDRHPPAFPSWPPRTISSNGASMLFGYLATNTYRSSPTCAWSPGPSKATGWKPRSRRRHCSTCVTQLDHAGHQARRARRENDHQALVRADRGGSRRHARGHDLPPGLGGCFRGGGFSTHFRTSGEMPVDVPHQPGARRGRSADRRGHHGR